MDKNTFSRLMAHPETMTPGEWEMLHVERDRHPYSTPLQVVSILADRQMGSTLWKEQVLPRVAAAIPDKQRLYDLIENTLRVQDKPGIPDKPEAPEQSETPALTAVPEPPPEDYDILKEINAYQEVSFKTAPKSVILTQFLEKDAGIAPDENQYENVPIQELAKKSIHMDESLQSETLALILEKQGKLTQAIEMYEKIIANNPEKSSTFAVQIDALKAQLDNK